MILVLISVHLIITIIITHKIMIIFKTKRKSRMKILDLILVMKNKAILKKKVILIKKIIIILTSTSNKKEIIMKLKIIHMLI
jgi:hypothetical protein